MKILLTNDDGYLASNIQHLFKRLSKEHDVWMIAPKGNCSGMSAAISFLKEIEITKIDEKTGIIGKNKAIAVQSLVNLK